MIARRTQLNETVTGAVVDYGNADVLNEVAKNLSTRISQMTIGKFVVCAERDDKLTLSFLSALTCRRRSFVNWCGRQRKRFVPS